KIVSLKRDIQFLEVEFQARSSQQQLALLNGMEFGFVAPGVGQYIEGERQLAALGTPRGPDAPSPFRMASAVTTNGPGTGTVPFIAMVSPVGSNDEPNNGAPQTADNASANSKPDAGAASDMIGFAIAEANGGERLARIEFSGGAGE
ncbi:MAG: hypothetical protein KUG65_11375, partial [Sphingomonadaceae bacterium]|nr:hypothetical protein [Sphingomonadaceae bacterium]